MKIWSNDYLILEGEYHEHIEDDNGILLDFTSSRSSQRKILYISKSYSKIEIEIL